jgi:hypothetical protein
MEGVIKRAIILNIKDLASFLLLKKMEYLP